MTVPRDIRQIKFITGEEILTEVVGEDHDEILIRNPLKVHRERMQLGSIAREANMFTRWMGFADLDEHLIKKTNILVEALVNDAVAMYYNKMTLNIEDDRAHPITVADDARDPDLVRSDVNFVDPNDDEEPTFH
jgi:hypothetical protein